ncbi:MAG: hypothetical protein LRY51_02380, partial [Geovibrio sp.]|nr:hypothetical protein [Geovibrio sp.]
QDIIMDISERMGIISNFNDAINKMGVMIGEISIAFLDEKDYFDLDKKIFRKRGLGQRCPEIFRQ